MPTRAGMGLLLLLVIMLIGAINYQNSLIYVVVFTLGSLFWVGLHHTYRNLAGLELHASGSQPVFSGEEASLGIALVSARREHQAIVLGWPGSARRQVDVPAGLSTTLTLYHPTERRGWLRPGRLRVETRFPLGWFVAWSLVDLDWQVLVYPRPVAAPLPGLAEAGEGLGEYWLAEGVDDFQGLRDYRPGDSRRRLDWRAWSRGQGLHSKIFAEPQHESQWLTLEKAPGPTPSTRSAARLGGICSRSNARRPNARSIPAPALPPAPGRAPGAN